MLSITGCTWFSCCVANVRLSICVWYCHVPGHWLSSGPLLSLILLPMRARAQASKSRDLVDANLVVYSVTDRASFQYAQSCLQELRPAKRHNVVILVANKQDIVRNRLISEQGTL